MPVRLRSSSTSSGRIVAEHLQRLFAGRGLVQLGAGDAGQEAADALANNDMIVDQ